MPAMSEKKKKYVLRHPTAKKPMKIKALTSLKHEPEFQKKLNNAIRLYHERSQVNSIALSNRQMREKLRAMDEQAAKNRVQVEQIADRVDVLLSHYNGDEGDNENEALEFSEDRHFIREENDLEDGHSIDYDDKAFCNSNETTPTVLESVDKSMQSLIDEETDDMENDMDSFLFPIHCVAKVDDIVGDTNDARHQLGEKISDLCDRLRKQLTSSRNALHQVEHELKMNEHDMMELEKADKKNNVDLGRLQQTLENLKAENSAVRSTMKTLKMERKKETTQAQEEIARMKRENENLKAQHQDSISDVLKAEKKVQRDLELQLRKLSMERDNILRQTTRYKELKVAAEQERDELRKNSVIMNVANTLSAHLQGNTRESTSASGRRMSDMSVSSHELADFPSISKEDLENGVTNTSIRPLQSPIPESEENRRASAPVLLPMKTLESITRAQASIPEKEADKSEDDDTDNGTEGKSEMKESTSDTSACKTFITSAKIDALSEAPMDIATRNEEITAIDVNTQKAEIHTTDIIDVSNDLNAGATAEAMRAVITTKSLGLEKVECVHAETLDQEPVLRNLWEAIHAPSIGPQTPSGSETEDMKITEMEETSVDLPLQAQDRPKTPAGNQGNASCGISAALSVLRTASKIAEKQPLRRIGAMMIRERQEVLLHPQSSDTSNFPFVIVDDKGRNDDIKAEKLASELAELQERQKLTKQYLEDAVKELNRLKDENKRLHAFLKFKGIDVQQYHTQCHGYNDHKPFSLDLLDDRLSSPQRRHRNSRKKLPCGPGPIVYRGHSPARRTSSNLYAIAYDQQQQKLQQFRAVRNSKNTCFNEFEITGSLVSKMKK